MMQSLYENGRYYCAGCHRYKSTDQCRDKGRLYCQECGAQVRRGPRKSRR